MATSSKAQVRTFDGSFYLPTVSLAMLAGLLLSLTLPVVLSFPFSAMNSTLSTLLPQLWSLFFSWFTPPCFFLLLNGILVVLTASSGVFSTSSPAESADFYSNILSPLKQSSGAAMENFSASTLKPHAVFYACRAVERNFHDVNGEDEGEEEDFFCKSSVLAMESRSFSFRWAESRISEEEEEEAETSYAWPSSGHSKLQSPVNMKMSLLCRREEDENVQAMSKSAPVNMKMSLLCRREEDEIAQAKRESAPVNMKMSLLCRREEDEIAQAKRESAPVNMKMSLLCRREEDEIAQAKSESVPVNMKMSLLCMREEDEIAQVKSKSDEFAQTKSESVNMKMSLLCMREEDEIAQAKSISVPVNKKMSLLCRREEDEIVQAKSKSAPTSPQFAKSRKGKSIKRSLSVNSASSHGNQASSLPSAESLSDEAFRKRVEDFICKMNAQLKKGVN